MDETEIRRYCKLMEEIKARIAVMDSLFVDPTWRVQNSPAIESCGLQLRKVLELIALASLIANKDAYSKAYEKFATNWNARLIFRDLERINPHFYPKPQVEAPSSNPKALHHLRDRQPDYLTQDEFETAYEKCGAMMHAENPYGSPLDYQYYLEKLPYWRTRIINLLNNHVAKIIGETGMWLVHMKESQDDKVHHYVFQRL